MSLLPDLYQSIIKKIDDIDKEIAKNSGESHSEEDTLNYLNGYKDGLNAVRDMMFDGLEKYLEANKVI